MTEHFPRIETMGVTLNASERKRLEIGGDFFSLVSSAYEVDVWIDGVYKATLLPGFTYRAVPPLQPFARIDLENRATVANPVKIAYGRGGFQSEFVRPQGTLTIIGVADQVIGAGALVQIFSPDVTERVRRIIVKALSTNTAEVRIGGGNVAANVGYPLAPGERLDLDGCNPAGGALGDGIWCRNPSAAAQSVAMLVSRDAPLAV